MKTNAWYLLSFIMIQLCKLTLESWPFSSPATFRHTYPWINLNIMIYNHLMGVYQLLSSMDVTNANGPNGISTGMLKHTAGSITPSITKIFNLSLWLGCVPIVSVNNRWLCQILSQLIIKTFLTNADLSSLSYWKDMHKLVVEHLWRPTNCYSSTES